METLDSAFVCSLSQWARLLSRYPEIDWTGAIGFRDIIAHHKFRC
ncbi:MAG: HepT-like ribonuclease domain-containing protein [Syntrophobacteraceae bacterium]